MGDKIERMRLQEKCAEQREEIARLRAELAKLQAVVDAAREWYRHKNLLDRVKYSGILIDAINDLDDEP